MLDGPRPADLVVHETHRCSLTALLPDDLQNAVRSHVSDEQFASEVLEALAAMLASFAALPESPEWVDLVLRRSPEALEFGFEVGSMREVLVCTLT